MQNKQIRQALIIMVFGTFLGVLCSTVMNIAIPPMMQIFKISEARAQWVINGYSLVNALMIPVSAYLIKRYSFRNLFITFSGVFLLGTIIGASAHYFPTVVIARMIQAIGAGMMMPLVNVMAIRYATPGKQGQIMGIIGLAFNCAPILGPVMAGVILHYLSWRYLFILIIPFMILVLILSTWLLPKIPHNEKPEFSTSGLITVSLGLLALLTGFSNVASHSLMSLNVGGYIIIGIISLILFFFTQRKSQHQLINFTVFKHQQFVLTTIINMLIVATMYGNTVLLPLLVQIVLGKSTIVSALTILPGACLTGLLSTTSGRFYDRYPIKRLVMTGLAIDILGTIGQAIIGANSSVLMITSFQTIRQLGLVTILIPLQTQALALLPKQLVPDAVASFNTLRQIAASFGTAFIIGCVGLVNKAVHNPASHLGIQSGFTFCIVILLIALWLSRSLYHRLNATH